MKLSLGYLALGALLLASCSSSTTPQTDPATMQYHDGQSQNYNNYALDTLRGEPQVPGSATQSTMTLVGKGLSVYGRDNVALFRTIDLAAGTDDSGYYSQDANGDLYNRDFATSVINSNSLMQTFLGGQMHIGWIIQAKMKAAEGTSWVAFDSTIILPSVPLPIELRDDAVMMPDTTFQIGNKSYTAKHAQHQLSMNASYAGSWHGTLDTYVSGELGATVANITHTSQAMSSLLGSPKFQGLANVMVSHN